MSVGNFPESLSQAMLIGIMLVGRLDVSNGSGIWDPQFESLQNIADFRLDKARAESN